MFLRRLKLVDELIGSLEIIGRIALAVVAAGGWSAVSSL